MKSTCDPVMKENDKVTIGDFNEVDGANVNDRSKKGVTNIHSLPKEILVYIFSFLSIGDLLFGVQNACIQWRYLVYQKKIWTRLVVGKHFESYKRVCSQGCIQFLQSINDYVEEIIFRDLDDETLANVFLQDSLSFPNLKILKFQHSAKCNQYFNKFIPIFLSRHTDLEKVYFHTENDKDWIQHVEDPSCVLALSELPQIRNLTLGGHLCRSREVAVMMDLERGVIERLEHLLITMIDVASSNLVNLNSVVFSSPPVCYAVSDTFVAQLIENCPNLECLSVHFAVNISRSAFDSLSSPTKIARLCVNEAWIDDNSLMQVAKYMPRLTGLSISGCTFVTDVGISHVSNCCSDLREVVFGGRSFSLDTLQLGNSVSNITTEGLKKLAADCPNLRNVYLNQSLQIDDAGVGALAIGCCELTVLSISGCTAITDTSIIAVAENCPHLCEMYFDECAHVTFIGFNRILLKCQKIKTVDASSCHYISKIDMNDRAMTNLYLKQTDSQNAENHSDITIVQKCKNYSNMEICDKDNTNSSDPSGNNLGKSTSQTTDSPCLDDDHSDRKPSSPQSVHGFMSGSLRTSQLQSLKLDFCSKIGDDSLLQLAQYCPDLRSLSLNGCSHITDTGIGYLVQHCKLLVDLELSNTSILKKSSLTDATLIALAENCEHLERLNLAKINTITGIGVEVRLVTIFRSSWFSF